jgi:hypothetical protein
MYLIFDRLLMTPRPVDAAPSMAGSATASKLDTTPPNRMDGDAHA